MDRVDLAIVGGGVMGLATAWAATARGARVALVDPLPRENDANASNDESKVFRFAYADDAEWSALARDALDGWRSLEAESGERLLHLTGLLVMSEPGGFADATERTLRALGAPVERLAPRDALDRYPAFGELPASVVVDPHGGWIDPVRSLGAFERVAVARGLELRRGVAATGIAEDADGARVTLADGREIRARAAVVAAGFDAPALVPLPFAVTVTRQVELFFAAPPSTLGLPCFVALEEGYYGFPAAGGAVKIADHRKGPVVNPHGARPPPTDGEVATARAWLARRLPALADAPLARWRVCHYDNAPADRFLVGLVPGRRRTFAGAGFSGHGFKFAPEVGRRLAALALDASQG